ncbi:GNAT family protein [Sediminitomix flava]|uniref:Arginyl-tRNA--protein-N-Asp/Glu arginylyltransferase n=1 Tax=Sediminitomix flava TaxID=379075 RepID=A0A315ZE08_SEDFL|nr:GNAT family N-acetyltransferase [Sediminitomix flava]PWJ43369.1 arginyl-tRNA--protein-N-Asp/Glu arginylyltransferase [Sediminitomix flava]
MVFDINYFHDLKGTDLDRLLAEGWFRHTEIMARYELMFFDEQVKGVVPLRVDLENYQHSKGQRKQLKKITHLKREIKPLEITSELDQLYRTYRRMRFPEMGDKSIYEFFNGLTSFDLPYETWQVTYKLDGELIAASFFDVGKESTCGLLGIYHPEQKHLGLGFLSMLVEVEWAIAHGKKYYYPGYLLDSKSVFDYKGRLKNLEFFNWDNEWHPWENFQASETLYHQTRRKLNRLAQELSIRSDYEPQVIEVKDYFAYRWNNRPTDMQSPLQIQLRTGMAHQLRIEYLHKEEQYRIYPYAFQAIGQSKDMYTKDADEILDIADNYYELIHQMEVLQFQELTPIYQYIRKDVKSRFSSLDINLFGNAFPNFTWILFTLKSKRWRIGLGIRQEHLGKEIDRCYVLERYEPFVGEWGIVGKFWDENEFEILLEKGLES